MKLFWEVRGVLRSNVSARLSRPATWRDGRQSRQADDASAVEEIRRVVSDLPGYGYCPVWGTLCNERVAVGLVPFNAKRICRLMRTHGLLMQRRTSDVARPYERCKLKAKREQCSKLRSSKSNCRLRCVAQP
ncbi:protein of unknown function [Burkholderia multivorans]